MFSCLLALEPSQGEIRAVVKRRYVRVGLKHVLMEFVHVLMLDNCWVQPSLVDSRMMFINDYIYIALNMTLLQTINRWGQAPR